MPTTTNPTAPSNPGETPAAPQIEVRPFRLEPRFAERIWGKTTLAPWYAEVDASKPIGEAWLTGAECIVKDGPLAGMTLQGIVDASAGALGQGEFPLLVKMLFPDDKLSVQVHPDDEQAQALGQPRGKTECWYVLEAEPGAKVACGLLPGTEVDHLRVAAAEGTMESLLQMVEIEAGDMIFVDAGTVHAIGPGMTLLEVQQTCDITYRLFDYGRDRPLHLDQGLQVVKTATRAGKVKPSKTGAFTRLVDEKYFIVDLFEIPAGTTLEMPMDGIGCIVGIKGEGAVNEVRFVPGQAVVAPIGSVAVSSVDGASFARCWQPR